jgi:hypothetical protein
VLLFHLHGRLHLHSAIPGQIFVLFWYYAGEHNVGGEDLRAVIPLDMKSLWSWQARPWTMGILNVTPDSFSDGGTFLEVFIILSCIHVDSPDFYHMTSCIEHRSLRTCL